MKKIKQHSSTEMHMTSMVRWTNFQKKALQSAFDVSDVKGVEVREQERQTNREILTRLIDLTIYSILHVRDKHSEVMTRVSPVTTVAISLNW